MSKTKPATIQALVPDKARTTTSPPENFGRKLVHHPDATEAAQLIEQQAGLTYDQKDGAELEQAKQEMNELNARWKASRATMEALEKKKAGTKRYTKSNAAHSGKNEGDVHWKDWQRKDQILLCFTLVFLIVAVFMGAGNVYANLMSSGNPVFINDPWLAVMLSTLLPIGSAAIKFVTNFMDYGRTRRRYALCIFGLTLIALVGWSILFAMNFTGVSGEIDWDSLGESSSSGAALVWAQLTVELLAASALFLAAEDIYIRYAPDMYTENPEYLEIEKALANHTPAHEALRKDRAATHGRVVELSASRQAHINECVADFIALRGRFAAANK